MPLRTIVYIDGFNLYYGCLKRSPHCRWLDVTKFANRLINESTNNAYSIVGIKYFTSDVLASLSPNGDESIRAQRNYLRALELSCSNVEIIKGYYSKFQGNYFKNSDPIDFSQTLEVIRPEEKQTDVKVSIHMIADAYEKRCEQQVLVSNDSDFVPVLEMLKQCAPKMTLGLIVPIPTADLEERQVQPNKVLRKLADWSRWPIDLKTLEACQLPEKIPTNKKPITRPKHWC